MNVLLSYSNASNFLRVSQSTSKQSSFEMSGYINIIKILRSIYIQIYQEMEQLEYDILGAEIARASEGF